MNKICSADCLEYTNKERRSYSTSTVRSVYPSYFSPLFHFFSLKQSLFMLYVYSPSSTIPSISSIFHYEFACTLNCPEFVDVLCKQNTIRIEIKMGSEYREQMNDRTAIYIVTSNQGNQKYSFCMKNISVMLRNKYMF